MLKAGAVVVVSAVALGLAACGSSGGGHAAGCSEGNVGPAGKVCHHGVYVTPKAEVTRHGPPACSAAIRRLNAIQSDLSRLSSGAENMHTTDTAAAHLDSATEAVSELKGQVHNATWRAQLDSGLVILGRMRAAVAAMAAGDYENAVKPLVGAGPGYTRLFAVVETKICE